MILDKGCRHKKTRDDNGGPDIPLHFNRLNKNGLEIQRLVMASYLSAERGKTIDLTDKTILAELDSYVPAIQQGKGAAQLLHA